MSDPGGFVSAVALGPSSAVVLGWFAQSTALLAIAFGATWLWRRSSAALRHRVWCLAFAGLALVPALSASLPGWKLPVLPTWAAWEANRRSGSICIANGSTSRPTVSFIGSCAFIPSL